MPEIVVYSGSMKFSNVTGSKFRDNHGNFITESLFYEFKNPHTDIEPLYTIRDKEFRGYPSAKALYLESWDITEYTQAYTITENWDHWQRLRNNKRIGTLLDGWHRELEIAIRSRAIQEIIQNGKPSDMKWLAEKGWNPKPVGRPSKKAAEDEKHTRAAIEEDLKRTGLQVVK